MDSDIINTVVAYIPPFQLDAVVEIFISTAAWAYRIRTDEEGPDAVLGQP